MNNKKGDPIKRLEIEYFFIGFFSAIILGAALYFIYNIVTILNSEEYQMAMQETQVEAEVEAESEVEAEVESESETEVESEAGQETDYSDIEDEDIDVPESLNDDTAETDDTAENDDTAETDQNEERILFVGDSRTICMFADSDDEIVSMPVGNGITVYAMQGSGYEYLESTVDAYGPENFDVLVTWMGANDNGLFSRYGEFYDRLLKTGKEVVVCTVGPTDNSVLRDTEVPYYLNENMNAFNTGLIEWAGRNNVKVIDLYTFISESPDVTIDPADGIHYLPRPTKELWKYIISKL